MLKSQLIKSLLYILLIGALFIIIFFSLFSSKGKNEVNLVLRYDDYRNTSSYVIEKEILNLIEKHNATCSFGVIPFFANNSENSIYTSYILDSAKTRLISEYVINGDIEICLHGFTHQSLTKSPYDSEFMNLSYLEQFNKIKLGKHNLDSIFKTSVITFIPPWNSYDNLTLKALSDLNFQNISSDCYGKYNKDLNLKYIPFTADISEINKILQTKKLPYNKKSNTIILLVHDYDFKEISDTNPITDIEAFRKLFLQIVENKWNITSIKKAADLGNIFEYSQYRFNTFKFPLLDHLRLVTSIPGFQKIDLLKYYYLSKYQLIKLLILVVLTYTFVLLLINLLVMWLTPRFLLNLLHSINYKFLLSLVLLFAFIMLWMNDKEIGTYDVIAIMTLIGMITGLRKRTSIDKKEH